MLQLCYHGHLKKRLNSELTGVNSDVKSGVNSGVNQFRLELTLSMIRVVGRR